MKIRLVVPTLLLFAALAIVQTAPAAAQNDNGAAPGWAFGPAGGYNVDAEELFVGALFRFAPGVSLGPTIPLLFDGSFEYYFDVPAGTLFGLTATALAQFPVANSPIRPTAGAGLGYTRFSVSGISTSDISLNLQGGIMASIFALDAMFRVGDGSAFILRAAVLFGSLVQ